jgi:hypothetical protein
MGKSSDKSSRQRDIRVDSKNLQDKVATARSFIYDKGYGISSTHVEELLQGMSLVPTKVRAVHIRHHKLLKCNTRMRSQQHCPDLVLMSTTCLSPISCTSGS